MHLWRPQMVGKKAMETQTLTIKLSDLPDYLQDLMLEIHSKACDEQIPRAKAEPWQRLSMYDVDRLSEQIAEAIIAEWKRLLLNGRIDKEKPRRHQSTGGRSPRNGGSHTHLTIAHCCGKCNCSGCAGS